MVFKIGKASPNGGFVTLYAFQGPDGELPQGALLKDFGGNLYSTTTSGGDNGWGVVFKLDRSGQETILHKFHDKADGAQPWGSVIRDESGNLYGMAPLGGDINCFPATGGCGVVFKIDSNGKETVLHKFHGTDGTSPWGTLVRDAAGNLYGTTAAGDGGSCQFGCGTVFKLDPHGKLTVLHAFTGGADGATPSFETLLLDVQGNLYGTTTQGGDPNCSAYGVGCGVVFELTP